MGIDEDGMAKFTAVHEEASRVPANLTETEESSHLVCLTSPCAFVFSLLSFVPKLFHRRPLSAPEGPVADPGRRQGKGLKKNVLGTRPERCKQEACQITMSKSYECMKTQEAQD